MKKLIFILLLIIVSVIFIVLADFFAGFLLPGSNYSKIIWKNKSLKFNPVYYDQIRLREVPGTKSNSNKKIILSGCSYIYGDGLEPSETLAFKIANELPDYTVINHGISAGGFHHTLYDYEKPEYWQTLIGQSRSIFIYALHNDQLRRAGYWKSYCCPPRGPKYVINNETVQFSGFFQDFLNKDFILNVVLKSNFYNYSYVAL